MCYKKVFQQGLTLTIAIHGAEANPVNGSSHRHIDSEKGPKGKALGEKMFHERDLPIVSGGHQS
jgi:hypothetical protein